LVPCSRPRHAAAWRSRNRAPAGWVAWATNAITEGRARFHIGTQWFSRSGCGNRRAPAWPCGRGKLAQFSLLQRFAVWWVAPPWPILSVPAVLLALCRLVENKHNFRPSAGGMAWARESWSVTSEDAVASGERIVVGDRLTSRPNVKTLAVIAEASGKALR